MKRIPAILSLNTKKPLHIYDLFTDHGKIGESYSHKYQNSKISFIDIRKHLIQDIKNNLSSNELYKFIAVDANQCTFEDNSLVLMCGVGGNLIISCLQNYLTQENTNTQEFIICATMHHLEVRRFLQENNFTLKDVKVADENGHCYEVLLISYTKAFKKIEIFNTQEWNLTHPIHNRYLKSKIKSLIDKHTKEPWEDEVLLKLTQFVNGI